jgi:minor histocompatibility antigen H13
VGVGEPHSCSDGVFTVQEPTDFSVTLPELLAGSISVVLCGFYFLKKHWYLNNALGLTFSITGIEHLSLGATQTGIILLAGLFFYDIFWVFCTPVMVRIADLMGQLQCFD